MTPRRSIDRVALLLALVLCLGACSKSEQVAQTGLAASSTISPYIAMARGAVDVEGGLIRITAERDGVIKQVSAEDGDIVKAGQVLALMDERLSLIHI